jgi:hypothetical protein
MRVGPGMPGGLLPVRDSTGDPVARVRRSSLDDEPALLTEDRHRLHQRWTFEALDDGEAIFAVERYRAVEDAGYRIATADGAVIGVFIPTHRFPHRGFEVHDGTGAPMAELSFDHGNLCAHLSLEGGGGQLATFSRRGGFLAVDAVWQVEVLAETTLLDTRVILATPVVCYLDE